MTTKEAHSYKPEVNTCGDDPGTYTGNALRFATHKEAEAYLVDLASRWMAVRRSRVVLSNDPVNYRMVDGRAIPIGEAPCTSPTP